MAEKIRHWIEGRKADFLLPGFLYLVIIGGVFLVLLCMGGGDLIGRGEPPCGQTESPAAPPPAQTADSHYAATETAAAQF